MKKAELKELFQIMGKGNLDKMFDRYYVSKFKVAYYVWFKNAKSSKPSADTEMVIVNRATYKETYIPIKEWSKYGYNGV